MKIQTYLILFFLSISTNYAQDCGNFTQHLTINPEDGAIPQCTPVNCTLNLCNYTPNNKDVLVFIRFDLSFEFFDSNDFVLDNDPNNPTQVRLRLLTTSLQSGCTDFNFQIRSVGGTGHINGEVQFPNSGCPDIAIPSRFMVPQSISVVGTDGATTNISASFPGIPDRILVRGIVVLDQGTNGNTYEINGLPTFPAFIALDRNARIVVPNGMTLVVRNADIHGCINKWESIVVENGASLFIRETNVEDGRKAIVARDGAFITLLRNNFTDNEISYYTDYSSQTQNVNTRIWGCRFRGTGQLKPDNGMIPVNEIPTSGIEVHHTVGLSVGLARVDAGLMGTANSTIRCNQIQGSQIGLTSGLYLSTGGNNMISCNNIEGVSRGFNFLGMSDNTDFKGNQINSTNFGLQIQESSYIGAQDHRGNLFNGPFFNPNGDGAIHLSSNPNTIALSEFKVNSNFNSSFCPFPSGCGGNWFIEDLTNNNPFQCNTNEPFGTCPLGIGAGFQAPNEGGLNARLMSGNARDFSNPNILWTGQKQLYESLVNNRDLLANSRGFSSFVREQSQKSIGKYFAIQNNVRELAKRTHEMTTDVGIKAEENRRIVKEVNTIFDKYIETKDKTEKKQLEKQIKLLNQKITVNHNYNLAKLAEVESAKNRDIDQLIAENERLETRIQVEKNTKAVNRIMLEAFKGREPKLSEEQIRILEPIANQCPIDGGEAVYEARSLLGFVENRYYDDARLCPEINGLNANSNSGTQALKTAVTKAKLLTFNASPNPAKDVLDVVVNSTMGENTEGSFKIINALGGVVLSQKVTNNSQNHIDISTLMSGIYLVRLDVGGATQVQKITILK